MSEIVTLHHNEPMTTSLAIAEGVDLQHKNVIELIRKYEDDLMEFGPLAFQTRKGDPLPQGGFAKSTEYAWLNEQQSTLLITYLRNSDVVRRFKIELVKAFYQLRDAARLAASSGVPAFTTTNLSHGADLAVAADRTFRGFMRSARAAGMRLPQALRVANRQTLARTGMDMLAELEVDVAEIGSRAAQSAPAASGQVEAFIESWLDGQLPVPAVVCRSSDLYAAYRQYAKENAVAGVATAPNFCAAARRYERDLIFKVLHLSTGPGTRISARGVIPPALLLGIPEGQIGATNARMVAEFSAALAAWLPPGQSIPNGG